MTITIAALDTMPETEAAFKLAACCGSSKWVSRMLARRPFGSRDALFKVATQAAGALKESDWLEAFSHHPRIGQRISNAVVSTTAESWSTGEQSAAANATIAVRAALANANAEYEERHGLIFIICASGRSAEEILAVVRERTHNQRADEILIAADEQQQITRLRLEKLISEEAPNV
ncbi:MAG: 2-oxo-4-hydroxy-4-carboxy-5-ureidoimidazoline decarboxylase [bacterium]